MKKYTFITKKKRTKKIFLVLIFLIIKVYFFDDVKNKKKMTYWWKKAHGCVLFREPGILEILQYFQICSIMHINKSSFRIPMKQLEFEWKFKFQLRHWNSKTRFFYVCSTKNMELPYIIPDFQYHTHKKSSFWIQMK